jgi:hypothetical protein
VPSLAWREGLLDYLSCLGRGDSVFWDTTGIGAQGKVVRFFDVESFFDPALPPVVPEDPNVYQDPAVTGIGSRFTVAEMLWDITDISLGADENVELPVFLAIQALRNIGVGRLPYLVTYLDRLTSSGSVDDTTILLLTMAPEDQGFSYPATVAEGTVWPVPFLNPSDPSMPLTQGTGPLMLDDTIDTTTNPQVGIEALKYFRADLASSGTLTATLTTAGNLVLEFLDANHVLVATSGTQVVAPIPEAGLYYLRVRSAADPQAAAFTLSVQFD